MQQLEELLRFLIGHDELDLDGQRAGEFEEPLLVQHVTKGTPAANAGLGQDPLILTAINGKSISNDLPSYCEAIKSVAPGQTGTFTFATGPS